MRRPLRVLRVLLVLLGGGPLVRAQPAPPATRYTNAPARYQLAYPAGWTVPKATDSPLSVVFTAGAPASAAQVTVSQRPLPDDRRDRRLLGAGRPDSVHQRLLRLPGIQVLRLDQRTDGPTDEIDYEYTYAPAAVAGRTHVLGRQLWRGGYEFRVEYRAGTSSDARLLAEGRQLVESFAFTAAPWPSRREPGQVCDGKMYGIAALTNRSGKWEDDCRTIHEFSMANLTAAPKRHRQVLPFQSYALAKGFDNCLYSVTKAPTDAPERVYRYDPATRRGAYTEWQLPAQGPTNVWISAATDEQGDLYFMTSDANKLVRVSPHDGRVSVVWNSDPIRRAPYYPVIGFASAGTHGNFCLDDSGTMYLVYSTDGSLLKVDMNTKKAFPERIPLDGLPLRGGYSDLLMQNDAAGRRRMYLAGPSAIYQVDLARRQATRVRGGTYTDLAGCNIFGVVPPAATVPPPPPAPTTATWEGRVLDAATSQPLPQAQLRLDRAEVGAAVLLSAQGRFAHTAAPGRPWQYHAQHPGYFPADSVWPAAPGSLVRDILLRPLAVGTTQQLANVQFEQGKAALLPSSAVALNKLAGLMVDNPGLTIELRGHTDNVGPPEKNVVLSQQRVAAVKAYLAEHGVAGTRVAGVGLGGAEPLASNAQETTRRLNRRVEFRIVGL